MIITALKLYPVQPRWLFLKIETDEGICGWGEPVVEGHAHTVKAAVEEMSCYLLGKDPRKIEDLWQTMYRTGFYRGGPVMMSAIAGIDQALWDIKGKYYQMPVYEMLGGACRDKLKVYCWIGGDRPNDIRRQALEKYEQGYRAVKMNATEEMHYIDTFDKVEAVVERVAAIREALGMKMDIAVDFHGRVHKTMAKVLARELEPLHPMFIEEPVLPQNNEALREIARSCSIPIATGERMFSRWSSRTCCRMAMWTSFSLIYLTQAVLVNAKKSPPWRRPTTWRLHHTAPWDRSRWRLVCRWIPVLPMYSFRSRALAFTIIRAAICWTILMTVLYSPIKTVSPIY